MTVVVVGGAGFEDRDDEADDREGGSRHQRAMVLLREFAASSATIVAPGDFIESPSDDGYLRGHGTQVVDGQLMATVAGVVERVNKLVSVKPIKCRYGAECGDVVVGRVMEIGGKRWKVDINSRQAATLLLSAVNLPGGIQRRRTNVDELNMQAVFQQHDLISAEVQQVMTDGAVSLHTRNLKYGKLEGGMLVAVPPALIKRQKQHFHHLEALGVDIIFGCNGWVWIGCHVEAPLEEGSTILSAEQEARAARPAVGLVDRDVRASVVRLANVVRALAVLFLPIHATVVMELFQLSKDEGVDLKDMLAEEFLARVLELELERRTTQG